jgi:hypothetical protein
MDKKPKYNVGDEVYWNDPDDGACSGIYKVIDINDDFSRYVYLLRDSKGNETQAFEFELS